MIRQVLRFSAFVAVIMFVLWLTTDTRNPDNFCDRANGIVELLNCR